MPETTDPTPHDTSPAEAQADHDSTVVTREPEAPDKLVPVSEAIRYRRRAQNAEQSLQDLRQKFDALTSQLDDARQTIDQLERRRKIDELLSDSDTIDAQAARLLTEIAVEQMDDPDIQLAVDELKRHKPYLFRKRSNGHALAMPARSDAEHTHHTLRQAADDAVNTGNRRDLLRYLRLRRKPGA
ncbi:MAG: hypothetical protein GC164_02595 [Phycisphaera sp.]|nr:hypothetical protein [Phycisphaera sp.]